MELPHPGILRRSYRGMWVPEVCTFGDTPNLPSYGAYANVCIDQPLMGNGPSENPMGIYYGLDPGRWLSRTGTTSRSLCWPSRHMWRRQWYVSAHHLVGIEVLHRVGLDVGVDVGVCQAEQLTYRWKRNKKAPPTGVLFPTSYWPADSVPSTSH